MSRSGRFMVGGATKQQQNISIELMASLASSSS
jgi:hypothetical protein